METSPLFCSSQHLLFLSQSPPSSSSHTSTSCCMVLVAISTKLDQSMSFGNGSSSGATIKDLPLPGLTLDPKFSSLDPLNSVGRGLDVVLALEMTVAGLAIVKITSGCDLWTERELLRFSLELEWLFGSLVTFGSQPEACSILSGLIRRINSSWKALDDRFALFLLEDLEVTPGRNLASPDTDLGLWLRLLGFERLPRCLAVLRDRGDTLPPLPFDSSSSLPIP